MDSSFFGKQLSMYVRVFVTEAEAWDCMLIAWKGTATEESNCIK